MIKIPACAYVKGSYIVADVSENIFLLQVERKYRGADKSLARPGKKQATATEDFEFHISYL